MAAASSLATLSCAGIRQTVPLQQFARILFIVDYDTKQECETHKRTMAAPVLLIWVAHGLLIWAAHVLLIWVAHVLLIWAAPVLLIWVAPVLLIWVARVLLIWVARVLLIWAARVLLIWVALVTDLRSDKYFICIACD